MLNRVAIAGRLTRAPELRRTQSGIAVVSFSLACERDIKSQNGEKVTDFFDCVAWRTTAEFVNKYFTKGRAMVIDGKLQTRKWQDRDGNNRVAVEIIADSCYFADSKRDSVSTSGNTGYNTGSYGSGYSNPAPASDFAMFEDDGADLPF